MDANLTEWNKKHQDLRKALKNPLELEGAKQLFLDVHAHCMRAVISLFRDGIWKKTLARFE